MVRVTPVKRRTRIDLDDYVNIITGQPMDDIVREGAKITVSKDTGQSSVKYDAFVIVNLEGINNLRQKKILSNQDIGSVMILCETIKTPYNALYKNNGTVHTIESISELLDITYNNSRLLVQRLMKKGILYKLLGYKNEKKMEVFILNPYLAKRSSVVEDSRLEVFDHKFGVVEG
jgi:hypothetical protein